MKGLAIGDGDWGIFFSLIIYFLGISSIFAIFLINLQKKWIKLKKNSGKNTLSKYICPEMVDVHETK